MVTTERHAAAAVERLLVAKQMVAQVDRLVELLSADTTLMALYWLLTLMNLLEVYLHIVTVGEGFAAGRTWVLGALVVLIVQQDVLSQALTTLVELTTDGATVGVGHGGGGHGGGWFLP